MKKAAILLVVSLFSLLLLSLPLRLVAASEPLSEWLIKLQKERGIAVLYREAAIRSLRIDTDVNSSDWFQELQKVVQSKNLDLYLDPYSQQLVIFRLKTKASKHVDLKGVVVDAETGERLPFSTLSWNKNGQLFGSIANASGYFDIKLSLETDSLEVSISHLGHRTKNILLTEETRQLSEWTIRLQPEASKGEELLVLSSYANNAGEAARQSINLAQNAILGEANMLSSLQVLPSVQLNGASNQGLHLRGSPADGFRVELDGMTVYNQSHLFGLFDSFNHQAVQRNGLFYDVVPSSEVAPLGGLLSMSTRTGSLQKWQAEAGASNSSLRFTAHGPLRKNHSSLLLSVKAGLLNRLPLSLNDRLISWGLDVDRDRQLVGTTADETQTVDTRLTRNAQNEAAFTDLHGSWYKEWANGNRFRIAGYWGFDDIQSSYQRFFRTFRSNSELLPSQTQQGWNNAKLSSHFDRPIGSNGYSRSAIGFSLFSSDFEKSDFTYTQIDRTSGNLNSFTSPLSLQSIINDLHLKQNLDWSFAKGEISLGGSYRYFYTEYFEDSFERPLFFRQQEAHRADAFLQLQWRPTASLSLEAGNRSIYFSNGGYFEQSPSAQLKWSPSSRIQFKAGYSKNIQFLNRLSFNNIVSSDIWVLVDDFEPPASVQQYSAGLSLDLLPDRLLLQVEGYVRYYDHIRLHEIDTYAISNNFSAQPWFADNSGFGQGVELLAVYKHPRFTLSQAFTVSETTYENESINGGLPFPTDWDRPFQYQAQLSLPLFKGVGIYVSQQWASGVPNRLSVFGPENRARLGDFARTDISLDWLREWSSGNELHLRFSIYNLTDRSNPWYREQSFAVNPDSPSNPYFSVPVEVYDLGFQPSFSVEWRF